MITATSSAMVAAAIPRTKVALSTPCAAAYEIGVIPPPEAQRHSTKEPGQGARGVVVADVAPRVETRSADELLAASERRAPEVSIAAAFYNTQTGQTTTTTRATKTQKRKHQINSLAIAAAERELELMEKRGRATKTKAETNAKYGW